MEDGISSLAKLRIFVNMGIFMRNVRRSGCVEHYAIPSERDFDTSETGFTKMLCTGFKFINVMELERSVSQSFNSKNA